MERTIANHLTIEGRIFTTLMIFSLIIKYKIIIEICLEIVKK